MQSRRPRFHSWVGKILWRRDRLPSPVFLGFSGGSVGKESACNAGDLGLIPGLERFPWRRAWQPTPVFLPGESPWTEEPGRLQHMGSQRVGHNWATKHSTWIFTVLFFQLFWLFVIVQIKCWKRKPASWLIRWRLVSQKEGQTFPECHLLRGLTTLCGRDLPPNWTRNRTLGWSNTFLCVKLHHKDTTRLVKSTVQIA